MAFRMETACSPEGVPNIGGNPTYQPFTVKEPFQKPAPYPFSEPIMKILGKGNYKPKKDYTDGTGFKPFTLPMLPREQPKIVIENSIEPANFAMRSQAEQPVPKPPKRAPKKHPLSKAEKDAIWFKTLTLNKLAKLPFFLR